MQLFAKLDLPPVWALCTVASSWVFARMLPVARFDIPVLPWILAGAGLILIGWSAVHFRLKKTPMEPRKEPQALLVEGPYRINRNPIYTGMVLILIGIALGLGTLTAFLPVLAYPFLITERFIIGEEAGLRQAFGEQAENYISSTRRW